MENIKPAAWTAATLTSAANSDRSTLRQQQLCNSAISREQQPTAASSNQQSAAARSSRQQRSASTEQRQQQIGTSDATAQHAMASIMMSRDTIINPIYANATAFFINAATISTRRSSTAYINEKGSTTPVSPQHGERRANGMNTIDISLSFCDFCAAPHEEGSAPARH